jgi:hypothetical protein
MAIPMARVTIKRERERQLRQALWAMGSTGTKMRRIEVLSRSRRALRDIRQT